MPSASIPKIRLAGTEDVTALVELMHEFYAESNYPLDRDWAAGAFLKLLAHPELGCVWVADCGATVSGYVVLTFRYTMEHGALSGHVDDLFVRPDHRGRGVGIGLLSELLAECKRRSCGAIHVEVGNDNVAAMSIYKRLGLGESHDGRLFLQGRLDASGA
jgi:ribosomal protein S18 acetylase RimI-like enzyme